MVEPNLQAMQVINGMQDRLQPVVGGSVRFGIDPAGEVEREGDLVITSGQRLGIRSVEGRNPVQLADHQQTQVLDHGCGGSSWPCCVRFSSSVIRSKGNGASGVC
jgi:hypothetical protein